MTYARYLNEGALEGETVTVALDEGSSISSQESSFQCKGKWSMWHNNKRESITNGNEYYNIIVTVSLFLPHFFFQLVDIIRSVLNLSACSVQILLYFSVNYSICGIHRSLIISSFLLWSKMCAAVFVIVMEYSCETVTVSSFIFLSFMFQSCVIRNVSMPASPWLYEATSFYMIWGCHSVVDESIILLGYNAVQLRN